MKTEEKKDNLEYKEASKIIDKKTSTRIFRNLIIAVAIMAYFCGMALAYDSIKADGIVNVVKITTGIILAIALILMEIAFKKENKKVFAHSLEMLALAVHSLTTIHVVKINNFDFKQYILFSSILIAIYYVLKTIIINTKARKQYLNELSDIHNIVKKEQPSVKEAAKRENNQQEEEEEIKEDTYTIEAQDKNDNIEEIEEKNQEDDNEIINKKENNVNENKKYNNKKLADIRAKLRELQKQEDEATKNKEKNENKTETIDKEENKKAQTKKKNTSKTKKEQTKKEQIKKEEANTQEEVQPKEEEKVQKEKIAEPPKRKRGRPKKEVKKND